MKIPPGSNTHLNDLDNCPYKYFNKYVAKSTTKEHSDALVWGRRVHNAFDDRIQKEIPLPQDMRESYEPLLATISSWQPEYVEYDLGIRADGSPCAFNAQDVYFRGKLDVVYYKNSVLKLFDWKTGKRREEDASELEQHALLFKAHNPSVTKATGNYIWLQEPPSQRLGWEHDLSDWERTWAIIKSSLNTISNYATLGEWPKKPNPLCDWCPVKQCEHNGKWKQNKGKGYR